MKESFYSLHIRVHAGSSKRRIEVRDGAVHLYTTVRPIQGGANRDAARLIGEHLGIPKSAVTLFRGGTSKNKVFRISGSDLAGRRSVKKKNDLLIPFLKEV